MGESNLRNLDTSPHIKTSEIYAQFAFIPIFAAFISAGCTVDASDGGIDVNTEI
jgi:hypothetical protein